MQDPLDLFTRLVSGKPVAQSTVRVDQREAALPDTANTTRPNPQWLVQEMFGGVMPKEIACRQRLTRLPRSNPRTSVIWRSVRINIPLRTRFAYGFANGQGASRWIQQQ
jgi:hypothetical protein